VVAKFWKVLANCFGSRRVTLTVSLTVAVHPFKKPFIYAGFDNLNTDGHGSTWIQIPTFIFGSLII
jgi:hypothetical protein